MANRRVPSAREDELLEAAYNYALVHGLAGLSLRPLAAAIGSSPRVLLYLYENKDGLVRALLARARADELAMLQQLREDNAGANLDEALARIWDWLADPSHRELLALWLEGYARSLTDPQGPWEDFAANTVNDWLAVLAEFQSPSERDSENGLVQRTAALSLLRGALLDLLATGDLDRTTTAVRRQLDSSKRIASANGEPH
jgi:AcrR family transcriptional regulator